MPLGLLPPRMPATRHAPGLPYFLDSYTHTAVYCCALYMLPPSACLGLFYVLRVPTFFTMPHLLPPFAYHAAAFLRLLLLHTACTTAAYFLRFFGLPRLVHACLPVPPATPQLRVRFSGSGYLRFFLVLHYGAVTFTVTITFFTAPTHMMRHHTARTSFAAHFAVHAYTVHCLVAAAHCRAAFPTPAGHHHAPSSSRGRIAPSFTCRRTISVGC